MKTNREKLVKKLYDQEYVNQYISPIPPHSTPEEREVWVKELEWQEQEVNRRKREGFYKYGD